MLFTGYSGWIQGLRDWLTVQEYSDTQIAVFLSLAQIRMNRELASYPMEAVAPVTTAAPGTPIDLPTELPDFNRIRLVSFPGIGALEVKAINEIETLIQLDMNPGNPKFYCIDAGKLHIYPCPAEGVTVNVFYYVEVPPIGPTLDSNIFTDKHSDLLLYAASLEAAPYMVEDERIPVWESKYSQCLEAYSVVPKRIKMGSTPLVREIKVQ